MEGVCRGLSVVRVPLTKMIALASSRLRRPCPWVAAKTSTSVLGIRRSIASAVSVGAPRVRSSIDEVVGPGMTMTRLPLQKPSRLGSLFPGPRLCRQRHRWGPSERAQEQATSCIFWEIWNFIFPKPPEHGPVVRRHHVPSRYLSCRSRRGDLLYAAKTS